ncbi:MAG TPA: hemerythrin domain-containing protein [Candidatus Limnocylindrales bacterium]|nr:hemerythrin domain-containing protein [Candidatus Limnocylindrales bacterium]
MESDLIDVLIKDHDELRELFDRLTDPHLLPERSQEVASVAIAELVRHSVAEEAYLYPTARQALDGGEDLVRREIADHTRAEELMKDIEGVPVHDARFFKLISELATDVRAHIEEEETVLFPRMRVACDPNELLRLGARAEAIKRVGPTHPHPSAPDTPPWNIILAPGAGLVDRLRDLFSDRPTKLDDLPD